MDKQTRLLLQWVLKAIRTQRGCEQCVSLATEGEKHELLSRVYADDDGLGYNEDPSWGCEEATHHVGSPIKSAATHFKVIRNKHTKDIMVFKL